MRQSHPVVLPERIPGLHRRGRMRTQRGCVASRSRFLWAFAGRPQVARGVPAVRWRPAWWPTLRPRCIH